MTRSSENDGAMKKNRLSKSAKGTRSERQQMASEAIAKTEENLANLADDLKPASPRRIDTDVVPVTESDDPVKWPSRQRWRYHIESTLTSLGFVLGLGNAVTFPYLFVMNGGVASLIPLILGYVFVGLPLMYMEMALGQFTSMSPHRLFFCLAPAMGGIASSMLITILLHLVHVGGMAAIGFHFFALSLSGMGPSLPWKGCQHYFNSPQCYDFTLLDQCFTNGTADCEVTKTSECQQFLRVFKSVDGEFRRETPLRDYMGEQIFRDVFTTDEYLMPLGYLALSLLFIWGIAAVFGYLSIRVLGPFVCVISFCSIGIMLFAFIQGFFLPGTNIAWNPQTLFQWKALGKWETWGRAWSFVVFSLNLGGGGLIKVASHNVFNHNLILDAVIICLVDFSLSLMMGLSMVNYLGQFASVVYPDAVMADQSWFLNKIDRGAEAVFLILPEILSTTKAGWLQAALLFLMFAMLGLQSMLLQFDLLVSAMGDVWPRLRSNGWTRALCCGLIALVGGVFSFFNTAPPGYTAGQLMMGYAQFAVIAICLAQLLAVSYMYGFQRFISNVRTMLGETNRCQWLGAYWWISWIAIGPAILAATLIIRMAMHRPSKTFMYAWPIGLDVYGWMMFLAIVVLMPAMLIYQIIRARVRHEPIVALFEPLPHFGPAIFKDRDKCLRDERARRVL